MCVILQKWGILLWHVVPNSCLQAGSGAAGARPYHSTLQPAVFAPNLHSTSHLAAASPRNWGCRAFWGDGQQKWCCEDQVQKLLTAGQNGKVSPTLHLEQKSHRPRQTMKIGFSEERVDGGGNHCINCTFT